MNEGRERKEKKKGRGKQEEYTKGSKGNPGVKGDAASR